MPDRSVAALLVGPVAAIALATTVLAGAAATTGETTIEIRFRYSHYLPASITVPAGQAITFVLRNDDPIDHEWILGDAALHARHRTGTEPYHASRPTEVSVDAGQVRRTTITFDRPGTLTFVCHLPGHEAYGMTGTLTITGG